MATPFALSVPSYEAPPPPPIDYLEASEVYAAELPTIIWEPHRGPQQSLLNCGVYEVLYGGARGGGKTDGMLADFAKHACYYGAAARGVFFRRSLPQLEDAIRRSKELFYPLGARYALSSKTWTFPGGATLKFRYLQRDEDAEEYKGQQFSWICFEELTQWAKSDPVDKIRACLRSAEGIPCYFRATTNPGGPGHGWVKARYVSPAPLGYRIIREPDTGLERCYIPARLEHNPTLESNDPGYRARLRSLGNLALVEAWLRGSWDIADGGFWDGAWAPDKHISNRFKLPATWPLSTSFDWGYRKPASFGIWAESTGEQPASAPSFYPRGTLIRIAEWYTVKHDSLGLAMPDKGLQVTNERLGERIARICKPLEKRLAFGVADPSIWNEQGGYNIYTKMKEGAEKVDGYDLRWRKADNARIPGWMEVLDRLQATFEGNRERPGLIIWDSCENWIRTVPVLPRDKNSGDDIDSKAEDHAADETRYRCMARGGGFAQVNFNA